MKSLVTQTIWKRQVLVAQEEVYLGILHADMYLDICIRDDIITLKPSLTVWARVGVRTAVRDENFGLRILSSAKEALSDHGQVFSDHKDLGFRMRVDRDPWETQDPITEILMEVVRSLGFRAAYQATWSNAESITRPQLLESIRRAPHLMMLSRRLGHLSRVITEDPSLRRFLGAVGVETLKLIGYWHRSSRLEYDDLLDALSQATMVRSSWEEEPPCP